MAISATKLALGQEQIALQAVCSSLQTNFLCWGYTQSVCGLLESRASRVSSRRELTARCHFVCSLSEAFFEEGAFTCVPRSAGPAFAEAEWWLRSWESQMDQVEGMKTGEPLSSPFPIRSNARSLGSEAGPAVSSPRRECSTLRLSSSEEDFDELCKAASIVS